MSPRTTRPWLRMLALALVLGVGLGGTAEARKGKGGKKNKPRLTARATTAFGYEPLTVSVYAQLENVPDEQLARFCGARVRWVERYVTRSLETVNEQRSECREIDLEHRSFTRLEYTVTLYDPGEYTFRVWLTPSDGSKALSSRPIRVKVLESNPIRDRTRY